MRIQTVEQLIAAVKANRQEMAKLRKEKAAPYMLAEAVDENKKLMEEFRRREPEVRRELGL